MRRLPRGTIRVPSDRWQSNFPRNSRVLTRPLLFLAASPAHGENFFAVLPIFRGADATDREDLVTVRGPDLGDRLERRVGEDRERRLARRGRLLLAPRPELLEQRRIEVGRAALAAPELDLDGSLQRP